MQTAPGLLFPRMRSIRSLEKTRRRPDRFPHWPNAIIARLHEYPVGVPATRRVIQREFPAAFPVAATTPLVELAQDSAPAKRSVDSPCLRSVVELMVARQPYRQMQLRRAKIQAPRPSRHPDDD